jgi:glycosyltransferase involved in cell wall biosynthesis
VVTAAADTGTPTVCLLVPNGTHRPEALAAALAAQHPDWPVVAVWCGDPQLRPGGRIWFEPPAPTDRSWEHVLVASASHAAEWRRAVAASAALLADGAPSVVLLWVGSIAVLDDLAPLVALPADSAVLVPRGGAAAEHDDTDVYSTRAATIGAAGGPLLAWIDAQLAATDDVARVLEQAALLYGARTCTDPSIGVGASRWATLQPALVALPGFDPDQPWVLDATDEERAVVDVLGHPDREAAVARAVPQLAGAGRPLALPGGVVVDAEVRHLVATASARSAAPVPQPWSEAAAFRAWLGERYWAELHTTRRDLGVAFPQIGAADADRFRVWCRRAFVDDSVPMLVPVAERSTRRLEIDPVPSAQGLNLVGYLTRESSLGDVARRLLATLDGAGVAVAPIAYQRTASPAVAAPPTVGRRVRYGTSLAVVNADQFPALFADHPELFAATERMIGYWFWELEHIPRAMRNAFDLVDEVWAGSQFVTDAFTAVARVPVHHVPIPVPEPVCSPRARSSFAPLGDLDGRFVFAVVLDHFSVTERKNPAGAIEAFRRAFAPDEGPVLVVKTMNGEHRWPQHRRLHAAAAGRPDIRIWDEHLDRGDHMAFIAAADALVSLHRSEGLGLHLAEAMWLRTPVIATRYSGNLDFMDDTSAMLVDASMIAVTATGGEGVYPVEAHWADPDLDQAAAAMRRLVSDPAYTAALAAAARRRMADQPSEVATAARIAALLGIDQAPASATDVPC